MSNVERLTQAGILNPDALSPEQKDFIDQELTAEEVDDLIKVGQKLSNYCRTHPYHSFGGGFTFTV